MEVVSVRFFAHHGAGVHGRGSLEVGDEAAIGGVPLVQRWSSDEVTDENDADTYQSFACVACTQVHLINLKTGNAHHGAGVHGRRSLEVGDEAGQAHDVLRCVARGHRRTQSTEGCDGDANSFPGPLEGFKVGGFDRRQR